MYLALKLFENDVKAKGTKLCRFDSSSTRKFENDVKAKGTKLPRFQTVMAVGLRMM